MSHDINKKNLPMWWADETTVATAGTALQLDAHPIPDGVGLMLHADPDNEGYIFIAVSEAAAEAGAGTTRIPLQPGEFRTFYVTNSNLFWVDAANNSERLFYYSEGSGS